MAKYVTEERFDAAVKEIRNDLADIRNTFDKRFDKIFNILDGISGVTLRLDQERVFTNEWIHRIEADVNRIKGQLKIA